MGAALQSLVALRGDGPPRGDALEAKIRGALDVERVDRRSPLRAWWLRCVGDLAGKPGLAGKSGLAGNPPSDLAANSDLAGTPSGDLAGTSDLAAKSAAWAAARLGEEIGAEDDEILGSPADPANGDGCWEHRQQLWITAVAAWIEAVPAVEPSLRALARIAGHVRFGGAFHPERGSRADENRGSAAGNGFAARGRGNRGNGASQNRGRAAERKSGLFAYLSKSGRFSVLAVETAGRLAESRDARRFLEGADFSAGMAAILRGFERCLQCGRFALLSRRVEEPRGAAVCRAVFLRFLRSRVDAAASPAALWALLSALLSLGVPDFSLQPLPASSPRGNESGEESGNRGNRGNQEGNGAGTAVSTVSSIPAGEEAEWGDATTPLSPAEPVESSIPAGEREERMWQVGFPREIANRRQRSSVWRAFRCCAKHYSRRCAARKPRERRCRRWRQNCFAWAATRRRFPSRAAPSGAFRALPPLCFAAC